MTPHNMEGNAGDEAWGWRIAEDQKYTLSLSLYILLWFFLLFCFVFSPSLGVLSYLKTRYELDLVSGKDSNLALEPYRMCHSCLTVYT